MGQVGAGAGVPSIGKFSAINFRFHKEFFSRSVSGGFIEKGFDVPGSAKKRQVTTGRVGECGYACIQKNPAANGGTKFASKELYGIRQTTKGKQLIIYDEESCCGYRDLGSVTDREAIKYAVITYFFRDRCLEVSSKPRELPAERPEQEDRKKQRKGMRASVIKHFSSEVGITDLINALGDLPEGDFSLVLEFPSGCLNNVEAGGAPSELDTAGSKTILVDVSYKDNEPLLRKMTQNYSTSLKEEISKKRSASEMMSSFSERSDKEKQAAFGLAFLGLSERAFTMPHDYPVLTERDMNLIMNTLTGREFHVLISAYCDLIIDWDKSCQENPMLSESQKIESKLIGDAARALPQSQEDLGAARALLEAQVPYRGQAKRQRTVNGSAASAGGADFAGAAPVPATAVPAPAPAGAFATAATAPVHTVAVVATAVPATAPAPAHTVAVVATAVPATATAPAHTVATAVPATVPASAFARARATASQSGDDRSGATPPPYVQVFAHSGGSPSEAPSGRAKRSPEKTPSAIRFDLYNRSGDLKRGSLGNAFDEAREIRPNN